MRYLLCIAFLVAPVASFASTLTLSPPLIENGGVSLLKWRGEGFFQGVARYRDRLIYLSPAPGGAVALIGADIDTPRGEYPIDVAVTDIDGKTIFERLLLRVKRVVRPVERLTLPPSMVTPKDPSLLRRIGEERALLRSIFSGVRPAPLPDIFIRPVDDPVGSPFGLRRILNGEPRSPHSGIDFRSPAGREVRSPAPGTITFSGDLYFTGKTIVVDHGEGLYTLYAHLETMRKLEGASVRAGDILGTVGSTGRATGPHLHWGVKLRGEMVDPMALLRLFVDENP